MRLLFATLVVVSHTVEIVTGSRDREPLYALFGTLSLADLAVDGFFIISGYLITKSYIRSRNAVDYLTKRILRIYPAFVVAWLIVALLVAPLAGEHRFRYMLVQAPLALLLRAPYSDQAFIGTFYTNLNAPLWTIPWEFFCYLVVFAAGLVGILRKPNLVVGSALALLALHEIIIAFVPPELLGNHYGRMLSASRLIGMFLAGAGYYLFNPQNRYTQQGLLVALGIVIFGLCAPTISTLGVGIAGGYVIFALAFSNRPHSLQRINAKTDISYGVYLYAWPIEKLILMYIGPRSLVLTAVLTIIGSYIMGHVSWILVEKPIIAKSSSVRRWISRYIFTLADRLRSIPRAIPGRPRR